MSETNNKKSVNMTYKALYSFVLNTNVRCVAGVIGLAISFAAILVIIFKWGDLNSGSRTAYILLALAFTVINPMLLAVKAFRQLKLSPSYKKPIDYEFSDDGIIISQGEASLDVKWESICRLLKTNSMIAVYTSPVHAFVIPLSELGEDASKIIAKIVSFTAEYKPSVSRSLKQYQSGKGI